MNQRTSVIVFVWFSKLFFGPFMFFVWSVHCPVLNLMFRVGLFCWFFCFLPSLVKGKIQPKPADEVLFSEVFAYSAVTMSDTVNLSINCYSRDVHAERGHGEWRPTLPS